MRSHLEFRSSDLLDQFSDDSNPQGEAVANLLAAELPNHGYAIDRVFPEDWGWCVTVTNSSFPLSIGCGYYPEYSDGHLCFIEPSRPFIRRWLKRISTAEVVEPLATAIEEIIRGSGQAVELRWWTETEVARG